MSPVTVAAFRPEEWLEGAVRLVAAHLAEAGGPLYVGRGAFCRAVVEGALLRCGARPAVMGPAPEAAAHAVVEDRHGVPRGVLGADGVAYVLAPGPANRAALVELVLRPPAWTVYVLADRAALP